MNGKLTVKTASITLITSMLGAGINFMPYAFESVGYLSAIAIMSCISLMTFFTLYLMAYCASKQDSSKEASYSSIGYHISYKLGVFVDISILLALCLVCLAFYNYIVEIAVLLTTGLVKKDSDYAFYKHLFMFVIILLFYGLSFRNSLNSLKITSYVCIASVFYLIVLLVGFNFTIGDKLSNGTFKPFNKEYHIGLPIILLACSCQVNMVRIYNELETKSTRNILYVSFFTSFFGGLIYFIVGFAGYKLFGDKAKGLDMVKVFSDRQSVLNLYLSQHFPYIKYTLFIAVIGAMLVLLGTFPLQINPAALILVKLMNTKKDVEKLRVSIISILCASIYIINFYPDLNLDLVLGIVGAIFNNMLSFAFPCIFYLSISKSLRFTGFMAIAVMISSLLGGVYILYTICVK